jgi:serralysin
MPNNPIRRPRFVKWIVAAFSGLGVFVLGGIVHALVTSSSTFSVDENQTSVATLTSDQSGVTWSIVGGADQAAFVLNAATGELSFATPPDFETPSDANTNNRYEVVVEADDGNEFPTQAITVRVRNVNEAPVITSDGGGATAAVNAAENQLAVTTVTATDADTGQTRSYSITSGADQGLFAINANTGALTFVAAPDFETAGDADADNNYVVEVTATDNGTGNLTDTQTITVTVTDANDAPVVSSDGGGATAAVNAAEGQQAVTTVTATDADSPAQTVTFTKSGGADQGLFTLDPNTGVLTFTAAPDFETAGDADTNNTYVVEVTATDTGRGP